MMNITSAKRQNEKKLCKGIFSKIIENTWQELDLIIIQNSIRAARIEHLNYKVVPDHVYDPYTLQRWTVL